MHAPGHAPVILEVDLSQPPVTADSDDLVTRLRTRGQTHLRPLLRALHEAGRDRRVQGLIAKVGGPLPWATMQELRRAVAVFASSQKPTVAWAESFAESDTSSYVLAAAFDEIWLQPGGTLGVLGVGVETTFLRGALDRLGIEAEFEQRHEYKNAVDRFTRTEFTDAHRRALDALTDSVFGAAVEDIATARDLSLPHVLELVDTGPRTATEARDVGLIDRVGYRDEAYTAVRHRVGGSAELLFADRWRPPRRLHALRRQHVALVEVHGVIASGRSRHAPIGRQVGSDTVAAALRATLDDEHTAAVVLHVDSPGGSAVASEVIWREACRLRDAGKTLVVSMGSVAASGGYYIACPADTILALPSTLTGSIGVFGGKFVTHELLERIGITTGSVQRGARALMYSSDRAFAGDERARFAQTVDAVYADFVAKVASGRHRPIAEIEELARGRVWTGSEAVDIGLVDAIGGLRDAVRIARERADLAPDAPVRAAGRVSPVSRLGRAKNSEDPRAASAAALPARWANLLALPNADDLMLRMPEVRLR